MIERVYVHRDRDGLYAVVHFGGVGDIEVVRIRDDETPEEFEKRLEETVSRQRVRHEAFLEYFEER